MDYSKCSINIDNANVKIIISKPKPEAQVGRRRAVIRVSEEVYDELAELSNSTGITICELASSMIKFAREKTAIVEQTE